MKKFSSYAAIIFTYTFLYLPILVLIVYSFNSKPFPSDWQEFSLKWYKELISTTYLWKSFTNSLIIALSSTFLSLFMGVSMIYFRAQSGRIHKYIPLFYANLIIPETVLAVSLLSFFTLFAIPLGIFTLIASHTVIGLGFTIPILYTRFRELDPKMVEASLDLGATPKQTFFRITLPVLRPTLLGIGLLIFVISFDDFVLSYFCSGTQVETLSLYILSMIRSGISPIVNALSTLLLLLSGTIILVFFQRKKLFQKKRRALS
jgi:spermidine/putrescine transport system permease protein